MSKPLYKSLVIKIGTNVMTKDDGLLNDAVVESLVSQISSLKNQGISVILVSSGAMSAGRALMRGKKKLKDVAARQVLAAVGQVPLIAMYAELFRKEGFLAAQVLATKEDFRDREHYLNMRSCLEALLKEGIIPIINENDVVSVSELMFTDNDELAGLVASMLNVDALILLTNVEGIYNGDPKDSSSRILSTIDANATGWKELIRPEKSQFGRGGMLTKCKTAEKLSQLGIVTHIAKGNRDSVLIAIASGKNVGTKFVAKGDASSMKRWVAGSEGQEKGSVRINACAVDVIASKEKAASVLPVGITAIDGDFEKGDLIRICDESGKAIGLGIASCSAAKAREAMGKKGKKALVHYDYLFLFS